MTKKSSPKTALARLLDNVPAAVNPLSNSDVGISLTRKNVNAVVKQEAPSKKTATEQTATSTKLEFVSADNCQPWEFADRPGDEMGDIDALANSIKTHGQQEPVLARPIYHDSKIQYEIIFGNRRWRACKKYNLDLLAIIKDISNKDAAVFQKEENENRETLSDYARAKSYQKQIRDGVFSSEAELSRVLGLSKQALNDIMAFTRIPDEVFNAISEPKNLSRATAVTIARLSKVSGNIELLVKLAPKISKKELTAKNLTSAISSLSSPSTMNKSEEMDRIIFENKGQKGAIVLKRSHSGEITMKIPAAISNEINIDDILKQLRANVDVCK